MNISEWITAVNGRPIDVDGAYGAQCWDLWSHYAQNVWGVPQSETNTTDGYAASVYTTKYDQSQVLRDTFVREGADYSPVYGDVAFWGCDGWNHVAIVTACDGGTITCMSQNPTNAVSTTFNRYEGVIGYFHPRALDSGTSGGSGDVTVIAGTYRVAVDALNVREAPSVSSSVVATYQLGQTVNLDAWGVVADGYIWGRYTAYSGNVRYIALGPEDKSVWYLALQ
jgi:hypothetical protein